MDSNANKLKVAILQEARRRLCSGENWYICLCLSGIENCIQHGRLLVPPSPASFHYVIRGLKQDVREFLDGAASVECMLSGEHDVDDLEDSPLLLTYRLAIIDTLIARYSK